MGMGVSVYGNKCIKLCMMTQTPSPHVCLNAVLRARNPVIMGLKNCLRVAARNDVHHITVPLLLVHSMTPVSLVLPVYTSFLP